MNCAICPHLCELEDGETGKCNIITRRGNRVYNPLENEFSNISVDAIEKRPFFHFYPGSKFLACSWYGCNFTCQFCQNFKVSQQLGPSKFYSPEKLVELALSRGVKGIAFTHNEPILYYEYIHKVRKAIEASGSGLKIAVKTNGFASVYVVDRLCEDVDAINVDIKGDDADYRDICGGWVDPVWETIERIDNSKVHLELSYLVLPSKVKDNDFNRTLLEWLYELNHNIPLHLLYYFPFHKMQEDSYDPLELDRLQKFFTECDNMRYVYVSNCFHPEIIKHRNTWCKCGKMVVNRESGVKLLHDECCGVWYNDIWNHSLQTA
jgi:pyruvate formate lyase activating enzyme